MSVIFGNIAERGGKFRPRQEYQRRKRIRGGKKNGNLINALFSHKYDTDLRGSLHLAQDFIIAIRCLIPRPVRVPPPRGYIHYIYISRVVRRN